ncbi:MAG: adenylate/guanylate cyclase domain-containing protein [Oceanihabitans sp.]
MKKIICIWVLFFWIGTLFAQEQYSFKYLKKNYLNQTANVSHLDSVFHIISEKYLYNDADSALYISKLAYHKAEELNDLKHKGRSLFWEGASLHQKGAFDAAKTALNKSLEIATLQNDKLYIYKNHRTLGFVGDGTGDLKTAIEHYFKAFNVLETMPNTEKLLANMLDNTAEAFFSLGLDNEAKQYLKKSKQIYSNPTDKNFLLNGYFFEGDIAYRAKQYNKSLSFYLKALALNGKETNDLTTVLINYKLGNINRALGNYNKSRTLSTFAASLSKKIKNEEWYCRSIIELGLLDVTEKKFYQAEKNCIEGLNIAEKIGAMDLEQDACLCLYQSYRALGKDRKALVINDKLTVIRKRFRSNEIAKNIQRQELKSQMTKDSLAQVEKRYKMQLVHQEEVRIKDKNKNIAIASGFFLFIISIGLFSRWRFVKKAKATIEKEKDRSENLLLNILPAEIAEELKEKGRADARDFKNVSILFSDFKDFTKISEKMSAKDLVYNINLCFSAFDNIMHKYNIEKIKTIGDAYMAVGGMTTDLSQSVKNTVLAALEMQAFMIKLNKQNKISNNHIFDMRVGIHTGSVVAGIVGVKKFQYDIWGDTVNTASRMESNGEIEKVNISKDTYSYIKDETEFNFEPRGKILVKGKGEIEMFFVCLKQKTCKE